MAKRKNPQSRPEPQVRTVEPTGLAMRISWWALLAMIAIVPVIMSNWTPLNHLGFQITLPVTYDQFDVIKVFSQRILILVSIGAWAWAILTKGGKIRVTPVEWLVLAFLGWVTLSAVFSIHTPTALFGKYRRFEGLFSIITYAVAYFLVIQHADRPSKIKTIAQTLFWSGAIVAGYGVLQSLGLDPAQWGQLPFENRRAFATFGNPDLLGGFLMFSTFVSLGLVFSEERTRWRAIYWVGALLNFWCLIVAFTRSAWVGTVVGLIFLVLAAVMRRLKFRAVDWGFTGAIAALSAAVIALSLRNPNVVMNFGARLVSIFEFNEGSAKTRFQIWRAAWDAIQDRPVFGFGADTFRLIYPRYKVYDYVKDAGYLSVADNVHNYPLQLAAGVGVPGMLMFYSVCGWVAVRTFRLVFSREGGLNRWVLVGFWTACAAYVTHLCFGLSVTGASIFLWISMGALLAPTAREIDVRPLSGGIFAAVIIAALVAVGIGYHWVWIVADNAYLYARVGAQGADRVAAAERAAELNPYNDIYRAEIGMAYTDEFIARINDVFTAQQSGGDTQASMLAAQSAFTSAELSLKDTIRFVPWEYDNYVFLANLYNMAGAYLDPRYYEDALEIGKQGIGVEEYGPAIRLQYARALSETGREAEAIKQLEYAFRMDPAYVEAAMFLTDLYVADGRTDKAIEVLRAAQAWRPGQPGVAEKLASLESSITTP